MFTNCTHKRSYLWLPVLGAGKNLPTRPSETPFAEENNELSSR
jgi:hypothetical protein